MLSGACYLAGLCIQQSHIHTSTQRTPFPSRVCSVLPSEVVPICQASAHHCQPPEMLVTSRSFIFVWYLSLTVLVYDLLVLLSVHSCLGQKDSNFLAVLLTEQTSGLVMASETDMTGIHSTIICYRYKVGKLLRW